MPASFVRNIAAGFLWGGALAQASAQAIYTCVDAKGRNLTADRPIAECLDREQRELTPSGTVKRRIGPVLTAEERAAAEEKARKATEERNRLLEEKKRERALLTRYPNKATHDKERATALAVADTAIAAAKKSIGELAAQRKKLDTELEFYKGDMSKAPAALKRQIEENQQHTQAQERFIAAAERTGLITVLGDWVLQEACRQHEKWRNLGLPAIRMAVNVSAVQFREKNFSERAAAIIRRSGINPSCIEFEVTESAVMSDVEDAAKMLGRLKEDGVSIALDDFGTGYSSLSYLSQFPINKLKIDKSFIHNIDTDPRSLAIAETVIALGKKLGMTVIAEGIESQAGIKLLADIGCDLGQGFFISKPVRPDKLVDWYYQAQYKHLFV